MVEKNAMYNLLTSSVCVFVLLEISIVLYQVLVTIPLNTSTRVQLDCACQTKMLGSFIIRPPNVSLLSCHLPTITSTNKFTLGMPSNGKPFRI